MSIAQAASHSSPRPLPEAEHLPDDASVLKLMILELLATLQEERQEREQVQARLQALLKRLYGPKSERFNPAQPLLFADLNQPAEPAAAPVEPTAEAAAAEASAAKSKRKGHGRKPLPANLPHVPKHYQLT